MNNAITVETTIHANIERVWELWSTPEDIKQWNNPSDDWHTLYVENDLNNSGKFLFKMESKDGSDTFDFRGKYDKVIKNELIEYTLDDGRKTRNQFIAGADATTIIETFEPEAKTSLDVQKDFCKGVLENFKKYVENKNEK
jgi:uncharacterized protein YndB with AHSA1/START domain